MQRYVYLFKEGHSGMKHLLGTKGSRLCEIYRMGLPIPPGLVISTEGCASYYEMNRTYPKGLESELHEKLGLLERGLGKKLGQERDPLLVSVRAGAERQMPGLMESCCNVGLNDRLVIGLARRSGNERFAWDTYRRFVEDFSSVSMKIKRERFENAKEALMKARQIPHEDALGPTDLKLLVDDYMHIVQKYGGRQFPQNPEEQMWMTVEAIYGSWNFERSIAYRRMHNLLWLRGTGITIQAMVFGNLNAHSGAGRIFSRNPITGAKGLYGEYLMNRQGEDMIGGRVTAPKNIQCLESENHTIYRELAGYAGQLEEHFGDMQDIQFTIQDGKLHLLYSKDAKRTATAALKVATDLVQNGGAREAHIIKNLNPLVFKDLHYSVIEPEAKNGAISRLLGRGIPGSPCAASGVVVFDKDRVEEWVKKKGKRVVLVSKDCSADDFVPAMMATAYVTQRGGPTADFGVLMRELGKTCVLSCYGLQISGDLKSGKIGEHKLQEGDVVTVDGATGEIFAGEIKTSTAPTPPEYHTVMKWAETFGGPRINVNVDLPTDAIKGRELGALGIGLIRSEGFFAGPERMRQVQRTIFAPNKEAREAQLKELAQAHKQDMKEILSIMDGRPCVIRLLDSNLFHYIPTKPEEQVALASDLNIPLDTVKAMAIKHAEFSPSLGLRGTRMFIVHPEIIRFQSAAIFQAALELQKEGKNPVVCIELPMISSAEEYLQGKRLVEEVAAETGAANKLRYKIGLLLVIPRAALTIEKIAPHADFIHFGTNELTQLTCGFSRQDSAKFLAKYVERGIFAKDPFVSIDQEGVGEFVRLSIASAKKANPKIQFSVAGNHAYDPASIEFFSRIGIKELSCPPKYFAQAKLSAAQIALKSI